jgi:hypothetical protein
MDFEQNYFKGMVEKIVEINESLKCNLHYPWGGGTNPSTNAHVVKNYGEARLNSIDTF